MKRSLCCIKCGCRGLWIVDPAVQLLDRHGFARVPMIVAKVEFKDEDKNKPPALTVGHFQIVICANAQCGYTEWYSYGLKGLEEASRDPRSGVRFVSGDPASQGPYR